MISWESLWRARVLDIYSKASTNDKGMHLNFFLMHYIIKSYLMKDLYGRSLMNIQNCSHLPVALFGIIIERWETVQEKQ